VDVPRPEPHVRMINSRQCQITGRRERRMKKKRQQGSIMVAVRALDASSRGLLRKAGALARARRFRIDLVHVIALPYAPAVSKRASLRRAAQDIVADCKRRLTKLMERPELRGTRPTATVTWDYPAADGLVRQILRRRPQLLLAESHRHARLARPFLSNTDWELIRKCPCPLWLSKSRGTSGPVVAALDPLHARAKPAALDDVILRQALAAAHGRSARVLACHAYALPVPPISDGAFHAHWIGLLPDEIHRHEAMLERELGRLADRYAIPPANRIIVSGDPASSLPRIVRKHRASLVVMGAVSRSALARLFIGHTAERVIDALDCDVLIVKPRGFKPAVVPRPRLVTSLPPI
jgi:universal stress protein E